MQAQIVGNLNALVDLHPLLEPLTALVAAANKALDDGLTPKATAAIAATGVTRADLIDWALREAIARAEEGAL